MYKVQNFAIATDGSGAATVNGENPRPGRCIYAVEFVLGTISSGLATVTLSDVGVSGVTKTLLTLPNPAGNGLYYLRTLVHDATGTALTGTAGGDRAMPLITGKLQVVVSAGGATKTGNLYVWYYDED